MNTIRTRLQRSPARRYVRAAIVHAAGSRSKVGEGVHLLAGHHMGGHDAERFDQQLTELAKEADLVNVETAVEMISTGFKSHRPTIAFTFDDAFSDWAETIGPVLESRNVNACFFLNPALVGLKAGRVEEFNRRLGVSGKAAITAQQVRRLASTGHVIGAHTVNHAMLVGLEADELEAEIVDCKSQVSTISGLDCPWFAWPFGGARHIDGAALRVALETYDVVFSSDGYPAYFGEHDRVFNRRHVEPFWKAREAKFFLRSDRV